MSFMNTINARYKVEARTQVHARYGIKKDCDWFYLENEYWGDDAVPNQKISDPKDYPFKIVAKLKSGQKIGYACVDHDSYGRHCFIHEVDVNKKYRRKGVATAMYDFAEELTGKKCIPSSEAYDDGETHLSDMAEKFWGSRRK